MGSRVGFVLLNLGLQILVNGNKKAQMGEQTEGPVGRNRGLICS